MKRDDDVVRGVGYVTIQASHLEARIEEIAIYLTAAIERPKNNVNDAVSRKISWCKTAIQEINNDKLSVLDTQLDEAANLFDKRNKLVHGRIYFDSLFPERLVLTRSNQKEI